MSKPAPITQSTLKSTLGMPMQPSHDAHGAYHGEMRDDVTAVSAALAAAQAAATKVQRRGNELGEIDERRNSGSRQHIIEYASHRRMVVLVFIAEIAAGLMPGYFLFRPGARRLELNERIERWAMTLALAGSVGVVAIGWALAFGVVAGAFVADARRTSWAGAFRPGMNDSDPESSESAMGRQVMLSGLLFITVIGVAGLVYLNRVREAVGSDFEIELPWIVLALPGVLIAVFAGVVEAIWHSRPIAVRRILVVKQLDAAEDGLARSMSTLQAAAGRLLSRARSVSAVQVLIAVNQLPQHRELFDGQPVEENATIANNPDAAGPESATAAVFDELDADGPVDGRPTSATPTSPLARPFSPALDPGVVLEHEWALELLTTYLVQVSPKVDRWWLDPSLYRPRRLPDVSADQPQLADDPGGPLPGVAVPPPFPNADQSAPRVPAGSVNGNGG